MDHNSQVAWVNILELPSILVGLVKDRKKV